jgi:KDO2-lipid IV(A) lauroyltransferase
MFCYNLAAFKMALTLARCIPRPLALSIASFLGKIGYRHTPEAQAALKHNLSKISAARGHVLEQLCRQNIDHFSRMIADYFLISSTPEYAPELLDHWEGMDNLEAARAKGRGVILVTAHLGHWEMGAILLANLGLPLQIITLSEPTSELTLWRQKQRAQLGIGTITVGPGHDFAFVEMVQALRRNEIVAMLVDRPYEGTGLPVHFFGDPTHFSTGPALLWQHTGASVVPAFVLHSKNQRYTCFAAPEIPFESSQHPRTAIASNTQLIASYFESVIREHPEQWFNYVPIWELPTKNADTILPPSNPI